ncbi:hypothetical protein [Rhizobium herbae]|uniref:Uncharacterized protein n=1 Tax=Rhizobium herbae TaxID=508661 RepID=A0ABS4ET20_9HYPH|nr:hypothetical protein [Rhizobium herbae]MBP1861098.1 hypothetical protein [Rhizobium herbae]
MSNSSAGGGDESDFSKKDGASVGGATPDENKNDDDPDDDDPDGKKKTFDPYTAHGRQRAEEAKTDPHRAVGEGELFAKDANTRTQRLEI